MTVTIHPLDAMPDWLRRGAGDYPVSEGLTIEEVQQRLTNAGWVEYRCDDAAIPEGAVE